MIVFDTPGRNDPCHCSSGQKYKQCCLERDQRAWRAIALRRAQAQMVYARAYGQEADPGSGDRAPAG